MNGTKLEDLHADPYALERNLQDPLVAQAYLTSSVAHLYALDHYRPITEKPTTIVDDEETTIDATTEIVTTEIEVELSTNTESYPTYETTERDSPDTATYPPTPNTELDQTNYSILKDPLIIICSMVISCLLISAIATGLWVCRYISKREFTPRIEIGLPTMMGNPPNEGKLRNVRYSNLLASEE